MNSEKNHYGRNVRVDGGIVTVESAWMHTWKLRRQWADDRAVGIVQKDLGAEYSDNLILLKRAMD
jgi:hypothetical protein